MKTIEAGISTINGFQYSAHASEIRYRDRLDYALILCNQPCTAAGVFTTNKICAAPVIISKERINNEIRAILVNATNANACTGETGKENVKKLTADLGEKLGIDNNSILMASTGIIGHQLPIEKMLNAHDKLITELNQNNGNLIAKAIMTTDTHPKEVCVSFETSQGKKYIGGIAKGSGMIAPNMATLLSFIVTDATVHHKELNRIFKKQISQSFNALTIDGDTSTNDTAIILSPKKGSPLASEDDLSSFEGALRQVLTELSRMLVLDGEGVTTAVTVIVNNAVDKNDAWLAARSVAESLLVKTAIFGKDPNWGRIACALGYSQASIDESTLRISIGNIPLFIHGVPVPFDMQVVTEIMKQKEYPIIIDLGLGQASAKILTSDLSYDYVKINAEYSN